MKTLTKSAVRKEPRLRHWITGRSNHTKCGINIWEAKTQLYFSERRSGATCKNCLRVANKGK